MKLLGVLLITLSGITPASSVFVIAPGVIQEAGSGAFLSFFAAAIVGILMAYVYAELSSAYPIAGGEYAIVGRVLGPLPGFILLGLTLATMMLSVAVIALGVATYLGTVLPNLPAATTAAVTVAVSTLVAILNIRTNAAVTGIFLVVEILSLLALSVLGFAHVSRPLSDLIFHPVILGSSRVLAAAPVSAIGLGTAVAIFAYNGYGQAVYFGEELHDAQRQIARTILWALAIAVLAEFVPVTAILLGAPRLKDLLGSQNMIGDFITARGGASLNTAISLAIALAIFNAAIAILLQGARLLFSTARDRVWTPGLNRLLTSTHSRFNSPWAATVVAGVVSAAACYVDETFLLVVTGTTLVAIYAALCVATVAGRRSGSTRHGVYRMPLFPLPPVAAALALVYVTYANWEDPVIGRPSLYATVALVVISAGYYLIVLQRRGRWVFQGPTGESTEVPPR
jgi:amino acid transporter